MEYCNDFWRINMTNLFITLTKYIVMLSYMLYLVLSFFSMAIVRKKFNPDEYDEEYSNEQISKFNQKLEKQYEQKISLICAVQYGLILIVHVFCYTALYLDSNSIEILMFLAVQVAFLFVVKKLYSMVYCGLSPQLMNHMLLLIVTGLIMICRLNYSNALKQFIFIVVTMMICLVVPAVIDKAKKLDNLSVIFASVSFFLLLIVLVAGKRVYGSKNWIKIGPVLLQPSEFAKIIFVFAIAGLLSKGATFKRILITGTIAAAHVLILVAEKDLGGALIFFITYVIMIVVASGNILYLIAGIFAGGASSMVAYRLFSHIRVRVTAWKDPWSVIDNQGYQIAQSLFAIGTGGWFGLGLTRGFPSSIPVASTDFIFAAICEEMGSVTGICIILMYILVFVTILEIAVKLTSGFHKLVAVGLGFMIIFQTFLCIGGVIKFIPSTGVTLPLISYGGSSIVSTLILFNIIQGLYVLNQNGERRNEKSKRRNQSKNRKTPKN